jgi:hypothetical protein
VNESDNSHEEPEGVSSRREFLQGVKGWSAIAAAVALGIGVTSKPASAWLNRWGGSGWVNLAQCGRHRLGQPLARHVLA